MTEILIVDDEGNIRRMLRALLESEGYRVRDTESAEAGIAAIDEALPEVVLLDLALPRMSGLEALPRIRDKTPGIPVVMMSGQATLSDAVKATRLGAFHFIEKPLTPEAVLLTIRGALEVGRARDLTRALQEELGPGTELVGETPVMQRIKDTIRKVAETDARVLVTGESGTGKELAAAAIHGLSQRKAGPFVRVNSAAIPPDLVESELFGHERGAFTGATERRRGRFELAHEGTLFLDEVGDLDHKAQAKLLRALESGVIERVGGSGGIQVDTRVVAATNRNLREDIASGRFREDLYFRLDVVPIHMPPLRERRDDIPLLVHHVLGLLRGRQGLATPKILPQATRVLTAYDWPGNVRELRNIIERLAILAPSSDITAQDVEEVLPERRESTVPPVPGGLGSGPLKNRLDAFEREVIRDALDQSEGNVAEASRRLETDRANLYRRMTRLGLRNADHDDE